MIHFIILACILLSCNATPRSVKLPNYTGPALDMYSGYVTVDATNGRALFYWLIKAETDAANKPLLVWYQGGPGCSGLLGLFMENGPLRIVIAKDGTTSVLYNNVAWTQFANVLYIEQPAFVGFSYSNTSSDRNTGDDKAAADNLRFLENFVTSEFPEFLGRETWLTGESYAGVYVPTLTNLILADSTGVLYKQVKGFMIGNPVFSCEGGLIGTTGPYFIQEINLLYFHGLASFTNYNNWTLQGCNDPKQATQPNCQYILNLVLSQVGVIDQEYILQSLETTKELQQLDMQKQKQIYLQNRFRQQDGPNWPSLDPDNIFQDFCTGNGTLAFAETPTADTKGTCTEELTTIQSTYLNRPDVQTALGVFKQVEWSLCQNLNYDISGKSMVPLYENFFKNKPGFKILVFSGDLDILTVPFAFTQPCIALLSGTAVSLWQPWFVNGATAGYVEVYDKYTYATIKGAGHEAPLYQPLTSYQMIYRFLTNGHLRESDNEGVRSKRSMELKQSDMLRLYGVRP